MRSVNLYYLKLVHLDLVCLKHAYNVYRNTISEKIDFQPYKFSHTRIMTDDLLNVYTVKTTSRNVILELFFSESSFIY